MNNTKNKKFPLYIGIGIILLLLLLRFCLFYLRSDGFSGLSMLLPVLLLCFIASALCTSGFFAAWVYQDCEKRGEDPILWALVVFIATPFIGLLLYFLRRSEIKRPARPVDIRFHCGQTTVKNAEHQSKRRITTLW